MGIKALQNTIHVMDAEALAKELNIPFTETQNLFSFQLNKNTHTIAIDLLKDGQYIFVSVKEDQLKYPIEHIEFYGRETKDEILQEVKDVSALFAANETRCVFVEGQQRKLALEVLQDGKWERYGYPNTAIKPTQ
ncbi:hypothetical protein [Hymenobacter sp. DG25A]|uniref:hypothetical protein n=1 Tax=Hymenobacter sp. DG25A TaxID=1385663 RepID=UPI0006BC4658|nr:hypothetical protein [Hymenobacter sp. DG25A]ALD21420.1 hypothetical protein AM218_09555 [Hymenobacter sp. DG25A]